MKLLIAEEESSDGDEVNGKNIVPDKIDAPASHLIKLYAMRSHVETLFRDIKQDLGPGDCELRYAASAVGTGTC